MKEMIHEMDRKELIIRNFLILVEKYGFDKTKLSEVAKVSGLTKSGIYYYFQSKEELFQGALDMVVNKARDSIEESFLLITDPRERLKVYMKMKISFTYVPEMRFAMMAMDKIETFIFSSPGFIKKLHEVYAKEKLLVSEIIKEICVDDDSEEIERKSVAIIALTQGIFHLYKKRKHLPEDFRNYVPDMDKTLENIISSMLVYGVR